MAKRDRSETSEYEQQSEYETEDEAAEPRSGGSSGPGILRWVAVPLLFISFVFMVFAASTPVTKDFYLFSVKIKVDALITKVTNDFRFGVWGYCTTGIKNSTGKINIKVSKGGCKDRRLGWTFKDVPGMSDDVQNAISAALTSAFSLHVIAAATLFPAVVIAVLSAAKRDKPDTDNDYRDDDQLYDPLYKRARLSRRAFLAVLLALIFTGSVFVLDVSGVVLTRDTVHDKSKGIATLDFGPAFWFVVVAFPLVLFAFFIVVVDTFRSGKSGPPPPGPRSTSVENRSESSVEPRPESRVTRSEDPSTPSHYSREEDDRFYDVSMNSPQDEKRRHSKLR